MSKKDKPKGADVKEEEKKQPGAVAKHQDAPLPAVVDLESEAGGGMENIRGEDIAIPFMGILQSNSPQVKKGDARRIEGASEGDIFDNVTMELFDGNEGIRVIPVGFQKRYPEWKPRSTGGGLVKQHESDEIMLRTERRADENGKERDILPNGNVVVPTAYHYVLVVNEDGTFRPAVIGMASTQLKKSKQWNNRMKTLMLPGKNGSKFNPPCYATGYMLTTATESKGPNTWMGWSISAPALLEVNGKDQELFLAAKAFAALVGKGAVKAAPPVNEADHEAGTKPETNF